jgi:uncharacterized membrane protein
MPSKLLKQKQISPPSQVTQRVEMTKTETSLFIGPLPTPDALEKYEQIQPGIAERILQMAEKEQAERHLQQKQVLDMERRNLRSLNWNIIRAQIFALLSVIIISGLCTYFAFLGSVEVAGDTAKWVIASLAAVFITGRLVQKRQAKE